MRKTKQRSPYGVVFTVKLPRADALAVEELAARKGLTRNRLIRSILVPLVREQLEAKS